MVHDEDPEITWESLRKKPWPWGRCQSFWKYSSENLKTIDDCLENQKKYLKVIRKEGAVGVKFSTTNLKLNLEEKPDRKKAEQNFNYLKKGKIKSLPWPNDLHYYLLDKEISFASGADFVLSVHTGYCKDFRELYPLNLIPFIMRYPEANFDVYHLGYPWIRETIMLAKGFSNVYINFCWIHLISQKAATEALDEVIETIPVNKVIGFGGDYATSIENIYGHLEMAKDNLAEAISRKIGQVGWILKKELEL